MADGNEIPQGVPKTEEVTDEERILRRKEAFTRYLKVWQRTIPILAGTGFIAYMVWRGSFLISFYTGKEKAVAVIVAGFVGLFKTMIDGRLRELDEDKSIVQARQRVKDQLPEPGEESNAEDTYFDKLVKINVENLAAYYELVKIQTDKSFRASLTIAYFGAGLIVVGLALGFFRTDAGDKVTYIATGAGVLTEFISGVFFWLYSKTVRQLREYHDSLISVQNVLLSFKLVSDTKDPKDKAEMVSKMCSYLMTSLSRQVDVEQKHPPRKRAASAAKPKTEPDDDSNDA